ncbi:MAG TPA: DNA-processing protein DprA [Acidimicrobiales bacterium]|nr:DNA-processing protein DprA [Acidimicrobiales bacterium]
MTGMTGMPGQLALGELPEEAFGVALAKLPGIGPARLLALLRRWPAAEAWERVRAGSAVHDGEIAAVLGRDVAGIGALWRRASARADVTRSWQAHLDAGIGVHVLGGPSYPAALACDIEPPGVLFTRGDVGALSRRRVAIVGTRRCTRYGRDIAFELGHDLAANGVTVVSGLALGVDGAAHAGALSAGRPGTVAAVVGSGLDVVYPRRNAALWSEVGTVGVLLSEAPLGTAPESWRFPVRNRVIAALAEVVVVVESHSKGGSLHTVDAAGARGRPIMAVPGNVRSSASAFTNSLLADGCAPARDALDVFVALGLSCGSGNGPSDTRVQPDAKGRAVLEAIGWEPATLEEVVARSGLPPAQASVALDHLERDGWVAGRTGWWEQLSPAVARSLAATGKMPRP